jgi:hypothetical protein
MLSKSQPIHKQINIYEKFGFMFYPAMDARKMNTIATSRHTMTIAILDLSRISPFSISI